MTEEEKQRIRALFVMVLRLIKAESEANVQLSAELAAVLGAVKGLDPTFEDVLEHHRQAVEETTRPLADADSAQIDDMIRRVESGEFL
jgi:hypothetical protein